MVDQFSRAVVGFAVFGAPPKAPQIQEFLDRAVRSSKSAPRYLVTDRGTQFDCKSFKRWCRRRGIRLRFGRLGEPSSICIVERFIRSLKDECTRRLLVPMAHAAIRRELTAYATWYNRWRPHTTHDGRTPEEVFEDRSSPRRRYETRRRRERVARGATALRLDVSYVDGRRHLPVIALRPAA